MDRRHTGVRSRGESIILDFTYQGQRCRETLRIKPTKTSLKEASRKREAVLYDIAMGKFDYSQHFPNSQNAINLTSKSGRFITIENALKDWLKKKEKYCQYSTIRGYNTLIYAHLIPEFGHLKLSDLRPSHVEGWLDNLCISNKRINNILSPLRQLFKDSLFDEVIDKDPLQRVRFLPVEQREPSPLTQEEINLVLSHLSGQEHNLFKFAFWSGLRTSELIGLRWEDIDFKNNRFYVRVAVVSGREKTTKTASGQRTVDLHPESLSALKSQLEYTKKQGRVFHDPKTNQSWQGDQPIRKRVWTPALKAVNIPYRSPYQTRHTFASMMLSRGENPMWVAQQMGHKDWGMIRKVYGRWIA
jgi:integrase